MFRLIFTFFLLIALAPEVLAQRGGDRGTGGPPGQRGQGGGQGGPQGGGGQRVPGGPGGAGVPGGGGRQRPDQPPPSMTQPTRPPEAQPATQPEGRSSGEAAPASTGPGTVPQLAPPADKFVPLSVVSPVLSDTIVPSDVPYKVVSYASRIFRKYDLNGNGLLEREEWSKMPGAPQSIDTDGDFVITLDEMIRFIALYGNVRTIHRPNPPPTPTSSNWTPAETSPFRPFSAPPRPKTVPSESKPSEPETAPTEETDAPQSVDENTTEPKEESEEEAPSESPGE